MTASIDALSNQLQQLGKAITEQISQNERFSQFWGWWAPHLNKTQISKQFYDLSDILQSNKTTIDLKTYESEIKSLAEYVSYVEQNVIRNNHINQDPSNAIGALFRAYSHFQDRIALITHWQVVRSSKILTPALISKLQSTQADIENIAPDKDVLKKQIGLISAATLAAEELPTTLQRLNQTNSKISEYLAESTANNSRISDNAATAKRYIDEITSFAAEASALITQCEEAYRTTTSRGLAAAFDERATSLRVSIRWWVGLLSASLIAGSYIGYLRVDQLTAALNAQAPDWGVIWAKGILSVLSIGAPLWLAWLATKQIGQRFRLAEDYGFKASVAKAYEGYRREAAKIDDAFVSRLFGSALTRLEEAPLRFVEQETHSSPWDELRNSPEFREAVEKIPGLFERAAGVFKAKISAPTKPEAAAKPDIPPAPKVPETNS